jgi:uncharacterized membrane-anchored protein
MLSSSEARKICLKSVSVEKETKPIIKAIEEQIIENSNNGATELKFMMPTEFENPFINDKIVRYKLYCYIIDKLEESGYGVKLCTIDQTLYFIITWVFEKNDNEILLLEKKIQEHFI